ncbi:MAG: methyltransferase domain-containing protein [Magnetococcales bacterium]|nr:methyltransferase domain-containing protein [Magnetococcales bacterium]
MSLPSSSHIAAAFGGASGYDAHAGLQQQVADDLLRRLERFSCTRVAQALEIGCGTGYLSRRLATLHPEAHHLFSDLSAIMVDRCRRRLREQGRQERGRFSYLAMDGERSALRRGQLDLITSSMAMQWFHDPPAAVNRLAALLSPAGVLAAATLGEGTFQEWRSVCKEAGVSCGTPHYPSLTRWRDALEENLCWRECSVQEQPISITYSSRRAFLTAVKGVGAGTPDLNHQPVSVSRMRALLAAGDAPFRVTWRVLFLIARRE